MPLVTPHGGLGYIPDLGDPRDHKFRVSAPVTEPPSVDLRSKLPPAWDQGDLGSCTAFALTGAVYYLSGFVGSQLWLYYRERLIEHSVKSDSGAMIRDGVKVLNKYGLPPLADWPYDPAKFAIAPPTLVNSHAGDRKISGYARLDTVHDYRQCLAASTPFVVGITIFEDFESARVAKSGRVRMPAKSETMLGGHAVLVVGYAHDGSWIVRNSWGPSWGDAGYFHLPHDYLASQDLATDAWMLRP